MRYGVDYVYGGVMAMPGTTLLELIILYPGLKKIDVRLSEVMRMKYGDPDAYEDWFAFRNWICEKAREQSLVFANQYVYVRDEQGEVTHLWGVRERPGEEALAYPVNLSAVIVL